MNTKIGKYHIQYDEEYYRIEVYNCIRDKKQINRFYIYLLKNLKKMLHNMPDEIRHNKKYSEWISVDCKNLNNEIIDFWFESSIPNRNIIIKNFYRVKDVGIDNKKKTYDIIKKYYKSNNILLSFIPEYLKIDISENIN